MKLLNTLLNEIYSQLPFSKEERAGARKGGEISWRDQASTSTGQEQETWIIAKAIGKKYGPFKDAGAAKTFFSQRKDIPRSASMKTINKGERI